MYVAIRRLILESNQVHTQKPVEFELLHKVIIIYSSVIAAAWYWEVMFLKFKSLHHHLCSNESFPDILDIISVSSCSWKVCNRASREIQIWKLVTLNRGRILPCFKEYSEIYYFSCIYFIQKSFLLNGKDIKYRINKIYGLTLYILCICIYILRLAWQSKHSTKSKWTSRQDINSSPGMKES